MPGTWRGNNHNATFYVIDMPRPEFILPLRGERLGYLGNKYVCIMLECCSCFLVYVMAQGADAALLTGL